MTAKRLGDLVKTIRSTNAGTEKITIDIFFKDRETYELVKKSNVLTKQTVAELYRIPEERICDVIEFEPACAMKITMYRDKPSGSPGETDIFGSQEYPPLLEIEVPVE